MKTRSLLLRQWALGLRLAVCAATTAVGVLACALLLAVVGRPAHAAYSISYTYPGCAPTLQQCLDAATPGETIVIQPGTYFTSLTLNKAVSLLGVNSATVILQALPNQRVLTVTDSTITNSTIISGLTFAGGFVTGTSSCPESCGGGLFITATAQPRLQNLTVVNNTANHWGGGVYAEQSIVMDSVRVISNTAGVGGGAYVGVEATVHGGLFQENTAVAGGGLFTWGSLVLTGTHFISNTASAGGGGAAANDARLQAGLFQGNTSISGRGGGLHTSSFALTGTEFINNTAEQYYGGGAYAFGEATVHGGLFQENTAVAGGGLFAGNVALSGTQFLSNTGSAWGGGAFADGEAKLQDVLFQGNTAANQGGGMYAYSRLAVAGSRFFSNTAGSWGGGAFVAGEATLQGGLFQGNRSDSSTYGGGGLFTWGSLALTGTHFMSNTATASGGGAAASFATLNGGLFQDNTAAYGGGLFTWSSLTLTGTHFMSNTASAGGGLAHTGGSGRVVNALFTDNSAVTGTALFFASLDGTTLMHATIGGFIVGSGAAVHVTTGTVGVTNTIIVSHAVGIERAGGVVFQDYNLFSGNGVDTAGTVGGGAHSLNGNPAFISPGTGDYHLGAGSMAVDAGTNGGLTTDFEGDPRPQGAGFDVGFDESPFTMLRHSLYLPLLRR